MIPLTKTQQTKITHCSIRNIYVTNEYFTSVKVTFDAKQRNLREKKLKKSGGAKPKTFLEANLLHGRVVLIPPHK